MESFPPQVQVIGCGILAYYFAGLVYGSFVGKIVPNLNRNSEIISIPGSDVGTCRQAGGNGTDCCTLMAPAWVGFHYFIVACAFLWTSTILLELRLYVVADTIR